MGKSVPLLNFSKSRQSCVGTTPVLLSVGVVKNKHKETPLERKGSEEPVRNADSEQLLNIFWSVSSVQCFFFLQTRWAILCGVDVLKSQEGNATSKARLSKRRSGRKQTVKLFNIFWSVISVRFSIGS